MGDISEMRAIVVVFSFVAVGIFLISLMVSESPGLFIGPTQIGEQAGPNSVSIPTDLLSWNSSLTVNLTGPAGEYSFTLAGWNYRIDAFTLMYNRIAMSTYATWWIFQWDFDYFKWYKDGVLVSYPGTYYPPYYQTQTYPGDFVFPIQQLDTDFYNNETLSYEAKNGKTATTVFFSYNSTTYSIPSLAYEAGALSLTFLVDFDDRNTSINVLNFIGAIFSFSMPGIDSRLLFILMLPIIAATAYLVFIFVLRIAGAIFGGGGA
jgi:hypothetical protein